MDIAEVIEGIPVKPFKPQDYSWLDDNDNQDPFSPASSSTDHSSPGVTLPFLAPPDDEPSPQWPPVISPSQSRAISIHSEPIQSDPGQGNVESVRSSTILSPSSGNISDITPPTAADAIPISPDDELEDEPKDSDDTRPYSTDDVYLSTGIALPPTPQQLDHLADAGASDSHLQSWDDDDDSTT